MKVRRVSALHQDPLRYGSPFLSTAIGRGIVRNIYTLKGETVSSFAGETAGHDPLIQKLFVKLHCS